MIGRAEAADAGELLTLQRAAYVTEAQAYGDAFIAPLVEPLDRVVALLDTAAVVLKAVEDGRMVGAVRTAVQGRTCLVSRLVVAPDMQGRGIGTALLRAVEDEMRGLVTSLVLFTGHLSAGNLRLYRRLGYVEYRRERVSDHLVHVHLRKPLSEHAETVTPA
ncbi:GNAT family N-acetyltransferase [Actinocorallia sp. A-T 12471]|uniref:GNAT family N-acetyltransferase n=1 Tax=Actinocorallia sp. A-T 12471 TaxID=3089813 RepID=UPI0029CFF3F6|nr:GNAT family N-acetyltransferase [Actinocorallia sp. A-T 12471]MDX6743000.1 GNAT family N-acetyltransferase [Actinocorallia sp. A-T 12471]